MKHVELKNLEKIFREFPAPQAELLPPSENRPDVKVGQVWRINTPNENELFCEVIVLNYPFIEEGLTVVDVLPLIHDATKAGPLDYILPERIFCHHAAAMLSLDFSLPSDKLDCCLGVLQNKLVSKVIAHYEKVKLGTLKSNEFHMPDYIDEQDIRYDFHQEAAEQIASLQLDIYEWLDNLEQNVEQKDAVSVVIDARPHFAPMAPVLEMAAAGAERPERLRSFDIQFEILGKPAKLTLSQSVKSGFYTLVIYGDMHGHCVKVIGVSGIEIALIRNGEARFECTDKVGDSIVIANKENQPIITIRLR